MATTQDIHAPTLGPQGEPCASCGAPLAGDQRYCLECGARRSQARVDFREILAPGGAAPAAAPLPPAAAEDPPARSGPAFLGGLLCLLLALGVGVLIGNAGDSSNSATPPPPQVITVSGAAAAPAATGPAATTTAPAAGTSTTGSAATKSTKSTKPAKSTAATKAAASKKLQDLNSSSGSDYQKKSEKLPKEVGTAGKPAPKDDKPAGGGSDFQDIG